MKPTLRPSSSEKNPTAGELISLVEVVKHYPGPSSAIVALEGVSLEIYPGEFVGIFGKSGAGKTTLLNMITGVDHVTRGEVWVNGAPVHRMGENQLALWRGKNLGVIYQSFHLMPSLSLVSNVALPMDFSGQYRRGKSRERALELLREVELEEHAYKIPSAISGGQQQRVAIARALANDPAILIADEPTGRLDTATADTILEIFQRLHAQGKTIVMVTHDTSQVSLVTRVITMEDGRITGDQPGPNADSIGGQNAPAAG